jgi:tetratricopeptide (TPR) repeat protein
VPLYERQIAIREKQGVKQSVAIGLRNLADDQLKIGALQAAEANLRRTIALCREIENEREEAESRMELGRLMACRGAWEEAEEELAAALALFEKGQNIQGQGVTWAYRALRALLVARAVGAQPVNPPEGSEPSGGYFEIALAAARRALELADETANDPRFVYPVRDYVRAHWLLGAAHRANGDTAEADRHLSQALTRCRSINTVEHEADILLDLARLRVAMAPLRLRRIPPARGGDRRGGREEALRLAGEALLITERSGYVLQGADVHLFLAQMALEEGDEGTALEHAREARRLATCDGPPDYTYKVAYDKAGALLQRLESG